MANYKKTRRTGRSKRQKRRSLKRNNSKSRMVMRGGGGVFDDVMIGKKKTGVVNMQLMQVGYDAEGNLGLPPPMQQTIKYEILRILNGDRAKIKIVNIAGKDMELPEVIIDKYFNLVQDVSLPKLLWSLRIKGDDEYEA